MHFSQKSQIEIHADHAVASAKICVPSIRENQRGRFRRNGIAGVSVAHGKKAVIGSGFAMYKVLHVSNVGRHLFIRAARSSEGKKEGDPELPFSKGPGAESSMNFL
ncbi:MAG TPA: hypothetical protein VF141_07820 [Chryseolinea sp.]